MSAIFGVINLNGDGVSKNLEDKMVDRLNIYKLDSIKVLNRKNALFGCGFQYITPESINEILPYYEECSGITITADAIIDNRIQLFDLLDIPKDLKHDITDSQLILRSYKKWGRDCTKYLIGDFSFVIWDEANKSIFCARDHVGKRTFYYYYSNNIFAFSTLIMPIYEALDKKPDLNEKWISDFLSLPLAIHEMENKETLYNDIFQLPPASTLLLKNNQICINKYWNPLEEVKPLKLKSDKEYEEAFNKIFFEAVSCRLRCTNEVGVMLSGGLDSGSVACIAAKQLNAKNKRLKAFSSVPIAEYKDYLPKDLIADESEYVKSIVDMYNNIDLTYCRSENKNSATDIDFFINILEQPHKLIENLFWYNQIVKSASESGCKVLLNGQGGNMTISSGYFMANILTMLKKAKIIKVIKEINGYSKLYNAPKKYITNAVIRAAIPYNFKKLVRKKTYKNIDVFKMTPVNKNLIKKWDLEKRLKGRGFYNYPIKHSDSNQMKKYIVDPIALSQIALIETKLSLAHGIVTRDPTNDKRVIEFCISLPDEQYVRYGKERFLIRRAMKNILPDKIRLNYEKRGRQSADWVQRLQPYWQTIYNKLEKTLKDDSISNYIDIDKVKKQLESVGNCINEESAQNVRMLLVTFIFSQFINEYSKISS